LPYELGHVEYDVETGLVRRWADLARDGAHAVVEPGVPLIVGGVDQASDELSHARAGQPSESLPAEEHGCSVVGLKNAPELRHERTVHASTGEVRGSEPRREAPLGAPLGE